MMNVVIIGSGFAGYSVARELRQHDQEAKISIISQDDACFYSKPFLSKAMSEQKTPETLVMKSVEQLTQELNANILSHTTVSRIDTAQHQVYCHNKEGEQCLVYDKLVLACGAEIIPLPITGNGAENVHHANSLQDYRHFCEALNGKKRVALIGAGLIGCEFANDLSNVGYQVDVISLDRWVLPRLLPENIGKLLQQGLEKNGVRFHLGVKIHTIHKANQQLSIELDNGQRIEADVALSAIGLKPITHLAQQAGIEVKHGIVTNQYLQTSIENVYAIGDCAEVCGLIRQHIAPIRVGAAALAKTLTGEATKVVYPAMPIGIKTPAYRVVVCPPIFDNDGSWQIDVDEDNSVKALHYDNKQQLNGFILTGSKIVERLILEKQLAPWLK